MTTHGLLMHRFLKICLICAAIGLSQAVNTFAGPLFGDQAEFLLPLGNHDDLPKLKPAIEAFRKGDGDESLKLLQAAAQKEPRLPPARVMLARLFLSSQRFPVVHRLLEQAAAKSAHPETHLAFGNLALVEGRLTDALLQFRQAGSTPTPKVWTPQQRQKLQIEIMKGTAVVAENRGNWAQAERELRAWIELEPKNGRALERLGRAEFFLKRPDDALATLKRAAAADKDVDPPEVTLANFYSSQGDKEKIVKWLKKAVEEHPKDPRTHQEFAAWLLLENRAKEAQRYLKSADKAGPGDRVREMMRGLIARKLKDFDTAQKVFESMLQETPADFEASNQLALLLVERVGKEHRARALQLAEINARQFPRSVAALATLGWVYFSSDRLLDAERTLSAAVTPGGTVPPDLAYFLARVHMERDRNDEAKELLKKVVASTGRSQFRTEATKWLARLQSKAEKNSK